MSVRPNILAFAGSTREQSVNQQLVRIAAAGAEVAGAKVRVMDMSDFSLPLYDANLEARDGLPENALRLKDIFESHHGFLIAAPEYNSSITPLIKNTIDWVSRPAHKDEPPLVGFKGKVVALMSASPGALGGLRGLAHVRDILGNIGCLVLPEQKAIPQAYDAFDLNGQLKDKKQQAAVQSLGRRVCEVLQKLLVK